MPRPRKAPGVVIADGRWIITAAHVMADARRVLVRDIDGAIVEAVPGPRSDAVDLALLHVDEPLTPLDWAGELPAPGARVCAIGNAFGLDGTIACGVVSAAGRSDVGFNAIEDFIQTDAAVNPGMSGGALVDERGRLVGVLSAIFAKQSDANIGVNFAVSARLASVVAERLIGEGLYRPAAAGMSLRQAPDEGEPGRTGARVVAVVDGGAAALAGVRTGDTIVSAAGRPGAWSR